MQWQCRKALLAEMKIWEDEAQEQEQATAAGIVSTQLSLDVLGTMHCSMLGMHLMEHP